MHVKAREDNPDVPTIIYCSLRLPRCIRQTRLVVMGQSEWVFARRGYHDIGQWQPVTATARRRRSFFDGEETLATYVASLSDIDDLVPILTAFQIEWDKVHFRLRGTPVLDDLEAGPTEEEIAIAEAQVRQAEAAVRLIDAQIAQLTLTAPMDGTVTSRSAQAGETASAGSPLLTIANLDVVTLVIYVPVSRVGQVRLGQEVEVQVDSFPGRVFVGQVVNIAGEAEFTPRNVQTQEERVNLVFAVKVRVPNPDLKLKPGMPADAELGSFVKETKPPSTSLRVPPVDAENPSAPLLNRVAITIVQQFEPD